MSKGKWGESFLKSGLPLEHLTLVTLRSLGWFCQSNIEYTRVNREKQLTWFELDISATSDKPNKDTRLTLLIECKYHDLSRFWFFLPHEADRWHFNDRVLNTGPLQTTSPRFEDKTLFELAPLSTGGIVVSEDGAKQDNSVYTAVQQIANGFIPYCLQIFNYNLDYYNYMDDIDSFTPSVNAIIPMIVTNASIFRLRQDITDLETIRQASMPTDIADEVKWTWCFHEPSMALFDQNSDFIEEQMDKEARFFYRFPRVETRIQTFIDRPNWIAVVNIKHLAEAAQRIESEFQKLTTVSVSDIVNSRKPRSRKARNSAE